MKKPKNIHQPMWFPYPSSWLKAVILWWFTIAIAFILINRETWYFAQSKLSEKPEFFVVFIALFLLLPIPAIAICHRLLNIFFYSFIPKFISPVFRRAGLTIKKFGKHKSKQNIRKTKQKRRSRTENHPINILPQLTNWWAGLYSWLVFILSTIITVTIYTWLLPLFNLSYQTVSLVYKNPWEITTFYQTSLWISFALIWISAAAILYQIEYLIKQHLSQEKQVISEESRPTAASEMIVNSSWEYLKKAHTEIKFNRVRAKGKLSKKDGSLDIHITLPGIKSIDDREKEGENIFNFYLEQQPRISAGRNTKLGQKFLILLLIPIVAFGVYGFYRWQSDRQSAVVSSLTSPTASPVISETQTIPEKSMESSALPTPIATPSAMLSPPASISSKTSVLPPPDPYKLAINRATNAAIMAQSAKLKVEWEAVAIQWQDAVELMKIVPAFHPNYAVAKRKVIEYQKNANYASRVAATRQF